MSRSYHAFRRLVARLIDRRSVPRRTQSRGFHPSIERLEDRTVPSAWTVTNPLDSGPGSLRNAIDNANADTTSPVSIDFAYGIGVIILDSELPTIEVPLTIDGQTNGNASASIQGYDPALGTIVDGSGLTIQASDVTVRFLYITDFNGDGIDLENGADSGSDTIENCEMYYNEGNGITVSSGYNTIGGPAVESNNGLFYYGNQLIANVGAGIDLNGTDAVSNTVIGNSVGPEDGRFLGGNGGDGILIEGGSASNTIGGSDDIDLETMHYTVYGNVIGGNGGDGIKVTGVATSANSILGNYIGFSPYGIYSIPNTQTGVTVSDGAGFNTIGSDSADEQNVIIDNEGSGIDLNDASNDVVIGNDIGYTPYYTDLTTGNGGDGITIENGSTNEQIGDNASENIIARNAGDGIRIEDSVGTTVLSNDIGEEPPGTPVFFGGNVLNGIEIVDSSNSQIGFTLSQGGNLIAMSDQYGLVISGNSSSTNVQGNTVKFNNSGGIELEGGFSTLIGGTPGQGNVISSNYGNGISITGSSVQTLNVLGNFIGTDSSGTVDEGNEGDGIFIAQAASNITIGGASQSQGNIISGNGNNGVDIQSTNGQNLIEGNFIGTDSAGDQAIGNGADGVEIYDSSLNTVGGATATPGQAPGNLISGNGGAGVDIRGDDQVASISNVVRGDLIGTKFLSMRGALPNAQGVYILKGRLNWVGGDPSAWNVISGNTQDGVVLATGAKNNEVSYNYIGVDATGSVVVGNGRDGVYLDGAVENTIGDQGNMPANVISGNGFFGISFDNSATGNLVVGNYIGTDKTGTLATDINNKLFGNRRDGILLRQSCDGNTIGGDNAQSRNVICNSTENGVNVHSASNLIAGNYIGTDSTGSNALANGADGISIDNVNNIVGGVVNGMVGQAPGNLISGNQNAGVEILPAAGNPSLTLVVGNLIGTDSSGTKMIPNDASGISVSSSQNTIGGTGIGTRNVVSGNGTTGIHLTNSASQNLVQGNYVGTDITGRLGLPNDEDGVLIDINSTQNVIGGPAAIAGLAPGNLISGNSGNGIAIGSEDEDTDDTTSGNLIQGNLIGTDITGNNKLPNEENGILINASNQNTIGGMVAGAGNVVSGNQGNGISVNDSSQTQIQANSIGTDFVGLLALGNAGDGVFLGGGGNNTVGGIVAGATNFISGNAQDGIDAGTNSSLIAGNYIGTDSAGLIDLGNGGNGVRMSGFFNTIGGAGAAARNVISGNVANGVYLLGGGSNQVIGNYIGTDVTGQIALGNGSNGVWVSGSALNMIGGANSGEGNVISANGTAGGPPPLNGYGILITGSGAMGNIILGNFIGTNVGGTTGLGNEEDGIYLALGADNTSIGGDPATAVAGNVISDNGANGIEIDSQNNLIVGNFIGTNAAGNVAAGNGDNGILINNRPGKNTIGGTVAAARNVIGGNGWFGIDNERGDRQTSIGFVDDGVAVRNVRGGYAGAYYIDNLGFSQKDITSLGNNAFQ